MKYVLCLSRTLVTTLLTAMYFLGISQTANIHNTTQILNGSTSIHKQQGTLTADVEVIVEAYTYPTSMSLDGEFVIGTAFGGSASYFWTATSGSTTAISGTPYGVASDGAVGGSFSNNQFLYNGNNVETAGTWDASTGAWTFLGINPQVPQAFATDYNVGWDITADGSTIVGMQWYPGYAYRAFKWTQSNGYQDIGAGVGNGSRASGVSANGTVVYGWAETSGASRTPVIWYNNQAVFINSNQYGEAYGASPNGNYVTGELTGIGFLWTPTSTITFTNTLNNNNIVPTTVTNDGTVFGYTVPAWPPIPTSRRAFVRDNQGNITTFNDYAESRGMSNAQEWTFYSINDASEDGSKFIGAGINPQGQDVTFLITFNTNAPIFNINPTSINFGAMALGLQSDLEQLVITNEGTADLLINTVALGGNSPLDFILNDGNTYPVSIAPNQTITFSAAFAPQQLGNIEAEIDISSNAGYFIVPLSGTGITNVGMYEIAPKAPSLSPNPADDYTLVSHTIEIESVILMSSTGVEITRRNVVGSKQLTLWLSTLPNGMYYAMVADSMGKLFRLKLLIQH